MNTTEMKQMVLIVLAGCVLCVLSACATETEPLIVEVEQSELIGGEPVTGPEYDPIGALASVMPDGSLQNFCTGALTAPNVVTTAKHCLLLTPPDQEIAFVIGDDVRDPDLVVPIVERIWERDVTGGVMMLGSDTAVVILEEPIWDVTPVFIWPATEHAIGREFEVVGYGYQDYDPTVESGLRMGGTMELVGIGPMPYWQLAYHNDFDAYFEDYIRDLPPEQAEDPATLEEAMDRWETFQLAEDYEAMFERVTANVAGGDSGGPAVRDFFGLWISRGVASGRVTESGDFDNTVGEQFTVYHTFGPEAAHMVYSAPICQGISEEGRCDGDELRRCSSRDEGWLPHVIEEDCEETCVEAPGGAQCAPECAEDADCNAIAFNGMCFDGVCEWSPLEHCRAEGSPLACFLCCLGQATNMDYGICTMTCFAPPIPMHGGMTVSFPSFPDIEIPID